MFSQLGLLILNFVCKIVTLRLLVNRSFDHRFRMQTKGNVKKKKKSNEVSTYIVFSSVCYLFRVAKELQSKVPPKDIAKEDKH